MTSDEFIEWYARQPDGERITVSHHDVGVLTLDPPGLSLDLAALFPESPS